MRKYYRKSGEAVSGRILSADRLIMIESSMNIIVKHILEIYILLNLQKAKPEDVIAIVNGVFEVDALKKNSSGAPIRTPKEAEARHAIRYLMFVTTTLTTGKIAEMTGVKDHSNVNTSIKALNKLMDTDSEFKSKVDLCIKKLIIIQ